MVKNKLECQRQFQTEWVGCIEKVTIDRLFVSDAWCFSACADDEFKCANTGRCIPTSSVCNRINDCSDHSDELNCSQSYSPHVSLRICCVL